jgi:hypothetical protein
VVAILVAGRGDKSNISTQQTRLWQAADLGSGQAIQAHADYVTGLNNLTSVHWAMGDYEAALTLLRQSTELLRDAPGR